MEKVSFYDVHYRNNLNPHYKDIRNHVWGTQDIGLTSFLSTHQLDTFIQWLALKPGMVILDACCGNGAFTSYITQKSNSKSYGIDINKLSIEMANALHQQEKGSLEFLKGDLKEKLPFPNSSLDALVCLESIIHFSVVNRVSIFKEWHRVLKPGAKLIVTDPCIITGGISDTELAHRSIFGGYFFLPPGLQENLLRQNGFLIIDCEDTTKDNAAVITHRWWHSRENQRQELKLTESEEELNQIQLFLWTCAQLYHDEKLTQYAYYCERA